MRVFILGFKLAVFSSPCLGTTLNKDIAGLAQRGDCSRNLRSLTRPVAAQLDALGCKRADMSRILPIQD